MLSCSLLDKPNVIGIIKQVMSYKRKAVFKMRKDSTFLIVYTLFDKVIYHSLLFNLSNKLYTDKFAIDGRPCFVWYIGRRNNILYLQAL